MIKNALDYLTNEYCGESDYLDTNISLKELKQLAMELYEEGGSRIIECWTDSDILDWISDGNQFEDAYNLIDTFNGL